MATRRELETTDQIELDWATNPRWEGISRSYTADQVELLRPDFKIEHTLAELGAENLWRLLQDQEFVATFGALNTTMLVQMMVAGLQAIYLSGWQLAADGNLGLQMYPDQSLYPSNSMADHVKRLNNAQLRKLQIDKLNGQSGGQPLPMVADLESGFGGVNQVFELVSACIDAGVSGIHLEDQLASEKKCGHLGGKVLVPAREMIAKLQVARLAADVAGVPTIIIARTDADAAKLVTSDIDPVDHQFLTGERTEEGFYKSSGGLEHAIARGLAYAPHADLIWCETSKPNLDEARQFAQAIHAQFPGKMLAYNCSPSFNWRQNLSPEEIATFQTELAKMGYKFQFITLAGWHMTALESFKMARDYLENGMAGYVPIQNEEFDLESVGYTGVKHQQTVGTGYYDQVKLAVSGDSSTVALVGSTEEEQF